MANIQQTFITVIFSPSWHSHFNSNLIISCRIAINIQNNMQHHLVPPKYPVHNCHCHCHCHILAKLLSSTTSMLQPVSSISTTPPLHLPSTPVDASTACVMDR